MIAFAYVCMHTCVLLCVCVCVYRSEDNLGDSVLSFHQMGPELNPARGANILCWLLSFPPDLVLQIGKAYLLSISLSGTKRAIGSLCPVPVFCSHSSLAHLPLLAKA